MDESETRLAVGPSEVTVRDPVALEVDEDGYTYVLYDDQFEVAKLNPIPYGE